MYLSGKRSSGKRLVLKTSYPITFCSNTWKEVTIKNCWSKTDVSEDAVKVDMSSNDNLIDELKPL
ncbi:1311_t:CDS:2, partial [Entrophospora sp. SA101]